MFCLYVMKKSFYVLSALHQNFKQHHFLKLAMLLVPKMQKGYKYAPQWDPLETEKKIVDFI